MANFNLWASLPNFYFTSAGPASGYYWGLSTVADGGQPVWVDVATPANTYSPGVAGAYTVYMTTQDWVGTEQPLVTVATLTNFINPFGSTSFNVGNAAAAVITSGNSTNAFGGVIYWQNSTTVQGDYEVVFAPITVTYSPAPTQTASAVVSGPTVAMNATIANPTSWTVNPESSAMVLAYTTAASSTTENLYFQGFSTSGSPTSAAVQVASGIPKGTPYFIGFSNGTFYYRYTSVNGSATGLYGGTFNPATGAVGANTEQTSLPSFTSITGVASRPTLSNGATLRLFEGVVNGSDVLQAIYNNVSTPSASYSLTSTSDRFATTAVYDPFNNSLDYTVLAYTDNNQVHLELLNASGVQIASDFIIPGITSFDRIETLTGNSAGADSRVELDYTVASGSGTQIQGLIYDTASQAYSYTLGFGGNGEYDGTPFDDTITWGAGTFYVDGGGGSDTFIATTYTPGQLLIVQNASGQVVVSDGSGHSTTLARFSLIQLNGASISISGHVLTQSNADGTQMVSTYSNGSASVAYRNLSAAIWQNQSDGTTYEWVMSGAAHTSSFYLGVLNGWSNAGSFAFNGTGGDGVLWQNQSSGQVYAWQFVNGQHTGSDVYLGSLAGYRSAGVGAFFGSGTTGVLWQNTTSGEVYEWSLVNGQHSGADVDLGNAFGWNEVGTGDFTGNGTSDVLWQNASSGVVYEWLMSNGQRTSSINLGNLSGYTAIGVGAFTGAATRDILWQNNSTGEVWEWEMNSSGQNSQSVDLGNLSGYKVAAIGDYAGNGTDSIIWQGTSAGDTWLWTMANGLHTANANLGATNGWTPSSLTMS